MWRTRDYVEQIIADNGGKARRGISSSRVILVVGNNAAITSSKHQKAIDIGCSIITETELRAVISGHMDLDDYVVLTGPSSVKPKKKFNKKKPAVQKADPKDQLQQAKAVARVEEDLASLTFGK